MEIAENKTISDRETPPTMPMANLDSRSKVEQIVSILISRISQGHYSPGQRLVESELTSELNISRGPLREAMRILEAKDLIELVPNRGARVRHLKPEDIKQRFLLLMALGDLAIQCSSLSNISYLRSNLDNENRPESSSELFSKVIDFYVKIARLNHNTLLAEYIYMLNLSYFSQYIVLKYDLDTEELERHFNDVQQLVLSNEGPKACVEHKAWCTEILSLIIEDD